MEVYFSYWSAARARPLCYDVRNMHKLSAHLARKHYAKITMLTDSAGVAELSDIGYDAIEVVLDAVDPSYARVWSLSKIHAYKHIAARGRPFLHLDYDVFLHKPLPDGLSKAEVFTQSMEPALYEIPRFVQFCPQKQVPPNFHWPNRAWNMGIFGGVNCDFVTRYADTVLSLVYAPANEYFWLRSSGVFQTCPLPWVYAVIAEQFYLEVVSQLAGVEVSSLFPGYPSAVEAADFGYTHLMAAKDRPEVLAKLAQRCAHLALA